MSGDVKLYRIPLKGGWFANEGDAKSLESRLRPDFEDEGLRIVDDFFDIESPNAPANLNLVLAGYDSFGRIVSALIAQNDSYVGSDIDPATQEPRIHPFQYVTKVSVAPEKRGNGIMKNMMWQAVLKGLNSGMPVVLRTSLENANERYRNFSDAHAQIGDFHVHGFGYSHIRPENNYPFLLKFQHELAPYVAAKPRTALPIRETASIRAGPAPTSYIKGVAAAPTY